MHNAYITSRLFSKTGWKFLQRKWRQLKFNDIDIALDIHFIFFSFYFAHSIFILSSHHIWIMCFFIHGTWNMEHETMKHRTWIFKDCLLIRFMHFNLNHHPFWSAAFNIYNNNPGLGWQQLTTDNNYNYTICIHTHRLEMWMWMCQLNGLLLM